MPIASDASTRYFSSSTSVMIQKVLTCCPTFRSCDVLQTFMHNATVCQNHMTLEMGLVLIFLMLDSQIVQPEVSADGTRFVKGKLLSRDLPY